MGRNNCVQDYIVMFLDKPHQVSTIAVGQLISPHTIMGVKISAEYNVF